MPFSSREIRQLLCLLYPHVLKWVDKVKHLGNYMNKDCKLTVIFKKSLFIGYVNNLQSNFGNMQPITLISLFKCSCHALYLSDK